MSKTETKIGQDLASSGLCAGEEELRTKTDNWVQRLQKMDTFTQDLVRKNFQFFFGGGNAV